MKTKLLVVILTSLLTHSYAQDVSTPYIKTFLYDTINGERTLRCEQQAVESIISKQRVMISTGAMTVDLKIVKKGLGETGSWLGITSDSTYYFITVSSKGKNYTVLFQPVTKDLKRVNKELILVANYDVCQER